MLLRASFNVHSRLRTRLLLCLVELVQTTLLLLLPPLLTSKITMRRRTNLKMEWNFASFRFWRTLLRDYVVFFVAFLVHILINLVKMEQNISIRIYSIQYTPEITYSVYGRCCASPDKVRFFQPPESSWVSTFVRKDGPNNLDKILKAFSRRVRRMVARVFSR